MQTNQTVQHLIPGLPLQPDYVYISVTTLPIWNETCIDEQSV